jgi:excisionase family DNA binding protein
MRQGVRPVNDRLLTTREVADYLGFSSETVLRRYRAGELVGIRLASNVLRFRESDLEAWLELCLEGAAGRVMARLADLRSAAGGLDVHRHDRAHADQLALARVDPFGVERFCAVAEASENFRWVVVREFDPVRVAVDELDSDREGHAPEANRSARRLCRSARLRWGALLVESLGQAPAVIAEEHGAELGKRVGWVVERGEQYGAFGNSEREEFGLVGDGAVESVSEVAGAVVPQDPCELDDRGVGDGAAGEHHRGEAR